MSVTFEQAARDQHAVRSPFAAMLAACRNTDIRTRTSSRISLV